MDELLYRLNRIEDSYYDFVSAVEHYAGKKPERLNALLDYLKKNPDADSSDILEFVSDQDDFYEDAAYMNVV